MKWFKHFTDALDDPFTQELILRFGASGYLAWFGLLELSAKQMKPEALDYKFEFSPTFLKQKFHISPRKLQEIFGFCSGKVRLFCDFSQENWRFEIPKLLELKDNYSKDLQGSGKKLAHHKELRAKSKILEEDNTDIRARESRAPSPRIHIDKLELTDSMKEYAKANGINGHVFDLFADMADNAHKKNKLTNTLRGWEAQFRTFVRNAEKFNPKYFDKRPLGHIPGESAIDKLARSKP